MLGRTKLTLQVLATLVAALGARGAYGGGPVADDPYIYLEAQTSPEALDWVKAQNATTLGALSADPRFAPVKAEVKSLLTAQDRLPAVTLMGDYIYNFWQDETNVKGLWRRAKLADYSLPVIPWESLLDVDALARLEGQDWVWSSASCLPPAYQKCLLSLSHGGKDAVVVREFDVAAKAFVAGGFTLPEAKSTVAWIDADTLFVGTDWGAGTMTASGYPAQTRTWKRGTDWRAATLVYAGALASVSVQGTTLADPTGAVQLVSENPDFFTSKWWLRGADGTLTVLPVPTDADVSAYFRGQLVLRLRSDWSLGAQTLAGGSVVVYDQAAGKAVTLFAPTATSAVSEVVTTKDLVVVNVLDNVTSRLYAYTPVAGSGWQQQELALPGRGTATVSGVDAFYAPLLATYSNFLVPASVVRLDPGGVGAPGAPLRQAPARFDASLYAFEQLQATSADGTPVPYFVVHPRGMQADGSNPTLLYGYGGFEINMTPAYSSVIGNAWLAKGGVYVLANIRGGGEFGPAWHRAALKTHRQRAYDDFIAVAEDLIRRQITTPARLGIEGGSNGGLLVGAVMVERPELFNAVVCQVPLLDMLRFPLLGAGASWEGEYGDPSVPAERAAILGYSPYQNLKRNTTYPHPFFVTSTDDDRVTPAHARKMAARMESFSEPYYFYESAQGGHATPASADDAATQQALQYTYLYQQLIGKP